MKKQFLLVFFGLILLMVEFILWKGHIVLPAVLGYILIGVGSSRLQPYSIHFTTTRNLSFAQAVFALVLMFSSDQVIFFADLVIRTIDLGLIWFLLGGIRELALSRQREDLARSAARNRVLFIVLALSTAIGGLALARYPEVNSIFQRTVLVALQLVRILILILVMRSRKHLTNEPILSGSRADETPQDA